MLFAGQAPPSCFLFPNLPRFLPPSAFVGLGISFLSWGNNFSQLEKYFEAFRETASCGGWNPLLGREEPFREMPEAVCHSFKRISEGRNEPFSSAQERLFVLGRKSLCLLPKVRSRSAESHSYLPGNPFSRARKTEVGQMKCISWVAFQTLCLTLHGNLRFHK